MRRRRVPLREFGPYYGFAIGVLKPLCLLLTRRTWRGLEHVPAQGGVVLAANHISHADPIVLADYVVFGSGRLARFLAKSTLFTGRGLVARVMTGAEQIPVHRGTADAARALEAAVEALQARRVRRRLPGGHRQPRPGQVADAGADRRRPARPAVGGAGRAGGPVGRRDAARQLPRQQGQGAPPACRSRPGRRSTCRPSRGASRRPSCCDAVTDEIMGAITRIVEDLRGEKAPDGVHQRQAARSRHAPRPDASGRDGRRSA